MPAAQCIHCPVKILAATSQHLPTQETSSCVIYDPDPSKYHTKNTVFGQPTPIINAICLFISLTNILHQPGLSIQKVHCFSHFPQKNRILPKTFPPKKSRGCLAKVNPAKPLQVPLLLGLPHHHPRPARVSRPSPLSSEWKSHGEFLRDVTKGHLLEGGFFLQNPSVTKMSDHRYVMSHECHFMTRYYCLFSIFPHFSSDIFKFLRIPVW